MSKKQTTIRTGWLVNDGNDYFADFCADGVRDAFCLPKNCKKIRFVVRTREPTKQLKEWNEAEIYPCSCGCSNYYVEHESNDGIRVNMIYSGLVDLAKTIVGRRKRRKVWISCEYR